MILFAVYAVVVWFLAMRWRRTFLGFVVPIAAVLLAVAVTGLLRIWLIEVAYVQLSLLMWAEAIIVGGIGLFIACLPRRPQGQYCPWCWYDTRGLGSDIKICPECGGAIATEPRRKQPPPDSARQSKDITR